jgi:hypothetical protein
MTQLHTGDLLGPHDLTTISGEPTPVPDSGRLVHLQFRRYAGCPVCNLHLRSQHMGLPADFLVGRDGRIVAAKYGRRVDDHWSVDELLGLAAARRLSG